MVRTIGVVFSYEELNTNVLVNAMLWNAKKTSDFKYIAYAPSGFSGLFFAADEVVVIPDAINSFKKYSEVSEHFPPPQKHI